MIHGSSWEGSDLDCVLAPTVSFRIIPVSAENKRHIYPSIYHSDLMLTAQLGKSDAKEAWVFKTKKNISVVLTATPKKWEDNFNNKKFSVLV